MTKNVLIIDDHFMIRNALKALLADFPFVNIFEGKSCADLLSILKKEPISHVFLDLMVDDGNSLEVIPVVRKLYPQVLIMITTIQPYNIYANTLKQHGIVSFLQKSELETIAKSKIQHFLFNTRPVIHDENTTTKAGNSPFSKLSLRELEVLHYLLRGEGTKYIASNLGLESNTVSTLKARIFEKTGTQNLKELFSLALVNGVN